MYMHTRPITSDLKTDLYLILAGDSAKEALKKFGIEATKAMANEAVDKYITKEIMQKIWKVTWAENNNEGWRKITDEFYQDGSGGRCTGEPKNHSLMMDFYQSGMERLR